jgi:hypothetical protein
MATPPEPIHQTTAQIYRAYEEDAETGLRPHLGASLIGHACERFLWLTFRWVEDKKFPGRLLRLFETGQLEEARLVANLRRIGVEVHEVDPLTGNQWRVSAVGGHFGGSMDGVGHGIPEAPKAWHVLEFKTHNDKSFKELVKDGVAKAKPQHHAQMITYMGLADLERALYMAKNKNDDSLYTERVEFDLVEFRRLIERAARVITASEPPLRCSNDPSWWVCKMCDYHAHCHGNAVPLVNCRTCAHSTPELDGDARWTCRHHGSDLAIDMQRQGCESHRYTPILLERIGTQVDYVNGDVVYETANGETLINGSQQGAMSSSEIRLMSEAAE